MGSCRAQRQYVFEHPSVQNLKFCSGAHESVGKPSVLYALFPVKRTLVTTSKDETKRTGKILRDNFLLIVQQGQDYCSAVRNAALVVKGTKILLGYVVSSGERTVLLAMRGS